MNYSTLLLLVTLFTLCSCLTNRRPTPTQKAALDNCVLKFGAGINDIVLGQTTFKEIEERLGKGKRHNIKYESFTVENILPNTKYVLVYPEYDLLFSTEAQPLWQLSRVAVNLKMKDKCPCQTADGVGIGSSYQEVAAELGTEEISADHRRHSSILTYSLGAVQAYMFVQFEDGNQSTADDFTVQRIWMKN